MGETRDWMECPSVFYLVRGRKSSTSTCDGRLGWPSIQLPLVRSHNRHIRIDFHCSLVNCVSFYYRPIFVVAYDYCHFVGSTGS